MNRDLMLDAVRKRVKPWDLIVIGGGATGAGCCLDAAARGLDVLLVEQSDFGKGTSGRSTKLIHGGVRYLEQGKILLVREALRERGILRDIAPDHVVEQAFVLPCYSLWEKIYYGIGLKIYDLFSGRRSFGKSRFIGRKALIESHPEIKTEKLKGGVRYFDGRFDDTKLLINILQTAAAKGATILNYAHVKVFQNNTEGRIDGVSFRCLETGEEFNPRAKAVINAAGPFSDKIRALSNPTSKDVLAASQGIHLVFERNLMKSDTALIIPKTGDGRVLFAIPFYGYLLVGTTDTPVDRPKLEPLAKEEEIDFVMETCAEYFRIPPTRSDVKSVFAGIRPLVAGKENENTSGLSRSHAIIVDDRGLITIAGGKWTTYRSMAAEAVDRAIVSAGLEAGSSVTSGLELNYSDEFDERGLEEPLSPKFEWSLADVVKSIRFEMARTVEDVLARRTRILFLDAEEAIRVAPLVAELLAGELGYGPEWIQEQLSLFRSTAEGYRVFK